MPFGFCNLSFIHLGVKNAGHTQHNELFFDTLLITPNCSVEEIKQRAEEMKINLRYNSDGKVTVSVSNLLVRANYIIGLRLEHIHPNQFPSPMVHTSVHAS